MAKSKKIARRKTIEIESVKEKINHMIKHSRDDKKQSRIDIGLVLESILHETNSYDGFGYLDPHDMETSQEGTTFGIDQSREQKEWFTDVDHSRVRYF